MAVQFGRPLVKTIAAAAGLTSLAVAVPRLIRRNQAQQSTVTSTAGLAVVEEHWPPDGTGDVPGPNPQHRPPDGAGDVPGPTPEHWPPDGAGDGGGDPWPPGS